MPGEGQGQARSRQNQIGLFHILVAGGEVDGFAGHGRGFAAFRIAAQVFFRDEDNEDVFRRHFQVDGGGVVMVGKPQVRAGPMSQSAEPEGEPVLSAVDMVLDIFDDRVAVFP